jgi:uncharacterized protein YndB with AHSA1/START domain
MAALKRLQWSVDIAAPASRVYQILVAPESYTKWTSAFGEGLYFKGSWQKGQTIRFMTPGGDGVVSDIAENASMPEHWPLALRTLKALCEVRA